jgi:hypothetical protein
VRQPGREPGHAERARFEKAQALLDHAERDTQIHKGQAANGGGRDLSPPISERLPGETPRDYARRFEIDRERIEEGARGTSRHETTERISSKKTLRDVHLLHAAMEASDPSMGPNPQLAEEARQRSEEKRNPRPSNVRRVSRFRQLRRPHRDRPSAPRKDMSRGG